MATAQVIFQRFYYSKSLVKHDGEVREIQFSCMHVLVISLNFLFEVHCLLAKLKVLSVL